MHILLQKPPNINKPKKNIKNPKKQILNFYKYFIKLNLNLNSKNTKLSLIII